MYWQLFFNTKIIMKRLLNFYLIVLGVILIIQLIFMCFGFHFTVFFIGIGSLCVAVSYKLFQTWIRRFGNILIVGFEKQITEDLVFNSIPFICNYARSLKELKQITKFEFWLFIFFIKLNYPKDGIYKHNPYLYIFSSDNDPYYSWNESELRINYFKSLIK